jgi:hypothetical protein
VLTSAAKAALYMRSCGTAEAVPFQTQRLNLPRTYGT